MQVDLKNSRVEIYLNGGTINFGESIQYLSKVLIKLSCCEKIALNVYDHNEQLYIKSNLYLNKLLGSIYELDFENDIYLRGFSKDSGDWVEWKFLNPSLEILGVLDIQ